MKFCRAPGVVLSRTYQANRATATHSATSSRTAALTTTTNVHVRVFALIIIIIIITECNNNAKINKASSVLRLGPLKWRLTKFEHASAVDFVVSKCWNSGTDGSWVTREGRTGQS